MPGRPPKAWWDRCMADVRARGGAIDPARVCGAVWSKKSAAEKRAIVALEEGTTMATKKKKAAPKKTVRKAAKAHGVGRRIEGCFEPGAKVVVAEDVITTGGSALEAVRVVREEGGTVLGVLAVVDRDEGGRAALEEAGLAVEVLVTVHEIIGRGA
jgi:orotate phosphoribosyltransferase